VRKLREKDLAWADVVFIMPVELRMPAVSMMWSKQAEVNDPFLNLLLLPQPKPTEPKPRQF
jgi:hypothetical protein